MRGYIQLYSLHINIVTSSCETVWPSGDRAPEQNDLGSIPLQLSLQKL